MEFKELNISQSIYKEKICITPTSNSIKSHFVFDSTRYIHQNRFSRKLVMLAPNINWRPKISEYHQFQMNLNCMKFKERHISIKTTKRHYTRVVRDFIERVEGIFELKLIELKMI